MECSAFRPAHMDAAYNQYFQLLYANSYRNNHFVATIRCTSYFYLTSISGIHMSLCVEKAANMNAKHTGTLITDE